MNMVCSLSFGFTQIPTVPLESMFGLGRTTFDQISDEGTIKKKKKGGWAKLLRF